MELHTLVRDFRVNETFKKSCTEVFFKILFILYMFSWFPCCPALCSLSSQKPVLVKGGRILWRSYHRIQYPICVLQYPNPHSIEPPYSKMECTTPHTVIVFIYLLDLSRCFNCRLAHILPKRANLANNSQYLTVLRGVILKCLIVMQIFYLFCFQHS